MISDHNPNRGGRPIRNNFNKIVLTILLIVAIAIAIAFAIVFVGFNGKRINTIHKSEAAQLSTLVHRRSSPAHPYYYRQLQSRE